jgi:hypothetical protein
MPFYFDNLNLECYKLVLFIKIFNNLIFHVNEFIKIRFCFFGSYYPKNWNKSLPVRVIYV